ncbi:methionyl-tRNA formyltransferase [Sphingomonas sp.]|uniref:methionyl-tRNA formyltransferase n=1 Tax=Sphingomonas sp. TaxID=28214 RepID=UPI003CC6A151
MRIVFMGTPDFAVPTLEALAAAGHAVAAVYTQPPRPGGRRGRELVPSPVQRRAETLGIAVRSPVSLRPAAAQAELAALNAEIGVVAAYGLILPQAVLDLAPCGFLNVHGSLLPRWRGAAPVQRAIMAGDNETGVCIMRMEAGLDTGPVLLDGRVPIDGKTAGELTTELAQLGAALMVETMTTLDARVAVAQPDKGVTYAHKIDKAEARIDWTRRAVEIERLVRAMNPAPGAWFDVAGERVKVLAAEVLPFTFAGSEGATVDGGLTVACGTGALRPTLVQRAGGRPMDVAELLRGFPIPPGTQL